MRLRILFYCMWLEFMLQYSLLGTVKRSLVYTVCSRKDYLQLSRDSTVKFPPTNLNANEIDNCP
jgi:hypothetical protein